MCVCVCANLLITVKVLLYGISMEVKREEVPAGESPHDRPPPGGWETPSSARGPDARGDRWQGRRGAGWVGAATQPGESKLRRASQVNIYSGSKHYYYRTRPASIISGSRARDWTHESLVVGAEASWGQRQ